MDYIKLFESWSDEYILDFTDAGFKVEEVGDKLIGEFNGNFVITDINVWYGDLIDRLDYKYKVTSSNLSFSKKNKSVKFEIDVNLKYGHISIEVKNEDISKEKNTKISKFKAKIMGNKKLDLYPYRITKFEHHTIRLNKANVERYNVPRLYNYSINILCKTENDELINLYICESQMRELPIGPDDIPIKGFAILCGGIPSIQGMKYTNISKDQMIKLFDILPKLGKVVGNKILPLEPIDIHKIEDIEIDIAKNYK